LKLRNLIITALQDGKGRPAGDVAYMVRLKREAILSILNQLVNEKILRREIYLNRHRYYFLSDGSVLKEIPEETVKEAKKYLRPPKPSGADDKTSYARVCLGHLAGKAGVALKEGMLSSGIIEKKEDGYQLTRKGGKKFENLGLRLNAKKRKAERCLDWTERCHHIGKGFGNQLTLFFFSKGWIKRRKMGRSVMITESGRENLKINFGFNLK